jgi:protoheme IX farnesyltransferase
MASIAPAGAATRSAGTVVRDLVSLTKPRIIELLLVTTLPTMFVARKGVPPVGLMVATLVGGALAAGGANAINMVVDRDIDSVMDRTRNRPLVTGRISPGAALAFALLLEAVAFVELWTSVNLLSAVLAVAATLFYVLVYTLWLKRTTRQNIVVGGAAGAVPVLVGWTAVTGRLAWAPAVLFAIVFFWTPPHFWALAVRYRGDYEAAHVPMMPVVASLRHTARLIFRYAFLVVVASVFFAWIGDMGAVYTAAAVLLGGSFLAQAAKLVREHSPGVAMRLFHYSISYLGLLFVAMAVDVVVRHP